MEVNWTDFCEKKYYGFKEKRNILSETKREKADWIGHILHRNCYLKRVIKGKKEGMRRRGGRVRQLLDNLKETKRYWNLKAEAQNCTM